MSDNPLHKKYTFGRIIGVNLGEPINYLEERNNYSINDIQSLYGINLYREFAEYHRCVVISKAKFNYGGTILIAPISTYQEDDETLDYKIVVEKDRQTKRFLKHKSSILVGHIRAISKDRIIHDYKVHLPTHFQKEIAHKLGEMISP